MEIETAQAELKKEKDSDQVFLFWYSSLEIEILAAIAKYGISRCHHLIETSYRRNMWRIM